MNEDEHTSEQSKTAAYISSLITTVLVIAAIAVAVSPFYYLYRIKETVEAGDAQGVASLVDMQAVQESLGDAIAKQVTEKVKRKWWFDSTQTVTKRELSPERLMNILVGKEFPGTDSNDHSSGWDDFDCAYEDWSYFWFDLEGEDREIRLRLRRTGLVNWKLFSMELTDHKKIREEEREARKAAQMERNAEEAARQKEVVEEILGEDFISPEEIASKRGLSYSEEQTAVLYRTIPSEAVLSWLKQNDYMLVAGPPDEVSLLGISKRFFLAGGGGDWRTNQGETFASSENVSRRWYMLRKGPLPNSMGKSWADQRQLLESYETVPTAVELVWGLTCQQAVRNTYLISNVFVRTSSVDTAGNHIYVTRENKDGLYVAGWDDNDTSGGLGLASAREP